MTEQARRIAHLVFERLNERDPARFVELAAPRTVFHFPGTKPIEGPERIARFLKILFHMYPRLHFTVGRVVAEGRLAAAEWTNEGHNRNDEPYANAGVTMIELDDEGRIVYLSDTFKDTAVFMKRS